MPLSTITLKDSANVDRVFNLQSSIGTKAVYIDSTSTTQAPRLLIVTNATKQPGSKGSDRASILYQDIRIDPVTGSPVVLSETGGRTHPRSTLFVAKDKADALAFAKNYRALSGVEDAFDEGRVL